MQPTSHVPSSISSRLTSAADANPAHDRAYRLPDSVPSVARRLDAALTATPSERVFLSSRDGRMAWGTLAEAVTSARATLAENRIGSGDRVIVASGDEMQDIPLILACLREGVTLIVADHEATRDEIGRLYAMARPAAAWLRPDLAAEAGIAVPVSATGSVLPSPETEPAPEGIAAIVFTSGTTSRPKGVMLSYRALAAQLAAFDTVYGFGPESRIFNPLPLHHVDGLFRGVLAAAIYGAELHRPGRFVAASVDTWLEWIVRDRITHVVTVPTLLSLILRFAPASVDRLGSDALSCVISSADRLDPSLWTKFETRFSVPVTNVWGQSETVCDALYAPPMPDDAHIGTIGRPVGCQARIVNDQGEEVSDGSSGELQICGPIVMSGYLDDPEATAEVFDGSWLRTGDVAQRDADGAFHYVGRLRQMIVSRGVNIHPENVNAAMLTAPGVAEAATVGLPDPDLGERIAVAVVPMPHIELDPATLEAHCRNALAPEKRPQLIRVLPELPRGPSGKVVIDALIDLLAKGTEPKPADTAPMSVFAVAAECFGIPESELSETSTPFNTAPWDSLMHLNLITAIEAAYGLTMSPDDILGFASLGDADAIVARHLAARGA